MAPNKSKLGEYPYQAVFNVTESSANTLTFDKLETGMSVFDKVGWVVQRIEWRLSSTVPALFNTAADTLSMALTASNTLTTLTDSDPAIYNIKRLVRVDIGTAASGMIMPMDFVSDLSGLAGGGILVLPNPLYVGIVGGGLSGPATVVTRLFVVPVELSNEDYFNLVQSRQLLIST